MVKNPRQDKRTLPQHRDSAEAFAATRSYLQTSNSHGENPLTVLRQLREAIRMGITSAPSRTDRYAHTPGPPLRSPAARSSAAKVGGERGAAPEQPGAEPGTD